MSTKKEVNEMVNSLIESIKGSDGIRIAAIKDDSNSHKTNYSVDFNEAEKKKIEKMIILTLENYLKSFEEKPIKKALSREELIDMD